MWKDIPPKKSNRIFSQSEFIVDVKEAENPVKVLHLSRLEKFCINLINVDWYMAINMMTRLIEYYVTSILVFLYVWFAPLPAFAWT